MSDLRREYKMFRRCGLNLTAWGEIEKQFDCALPQGKACAVQDSS